MKLICLKCKSPNAWLSKTEYDLLMKCWCGYTRLLFTTLVDTLEGELEVEPGDDLEMKLPRMGSNLYKTLAVLSILPDSTSLEITTRLNELNGLMRAPGLITRRDLLLSVSDVSSYLTILRTKDLVLRTEVRRGVPGGSSWMLTEKCIALFEEPENGTGTGS